MYVVGTMAALTCGACLLPPPVDQAGTGENLPPRILPLTLVPSPSDQPVLTKRECMAEFGASLEDPDGDTLYWRVFVDYWAGSEHQRPEVRQLSPDPTGDAKAIRFQTSAEDFNVDDAILHTIELYVADRAFVDDGGLSGGRALIEEDGQVDRFIWYFDFEETLAQCP